jgi:hypothetical protein
MPWYAIAEAIITLKKLKDVPRNSYGVYSDIHILQVRIVAGAQVLMGDSLVCVFNASILSRMYAAVDSLIKGAAVVIPLSRAAAVKK